MMRTSVFAGLARGAVDRPTDRWAPAHVLLLWQEHHPCRIWPLAQLTVGFLFYEVSCVDFWR